MRHAAAACCTLGEPGHTACSIHNNQTSLCGSTFPKMSGAFCNLQESCCMWIKDACTSSGKSVAVSSLTEPSMCGERNTARKGVTRSLMPCT